MRVLLAVAIVFPAFWVSAGEVPIAHWTLDRDDVKDSQLRTRWAQGRARRTDGVHGDALDFKGNHQLKVTLPDAAANLNAITLSAWVKPIKDTGSLKERLRLPPRFVDLCNAIAYRQARRGVFH